METTQTIAIAATPEEIKAMIENPDIDIRDIPKPAPAAASGKRELLCPACHEAHIEAHAKFFKCQDYVKDEPGECNFILWRSGLTNFGRGPLTNAEAVRLIRGEQIPLKNLIGPKSGKTFNCLGQLAEVDLPNGRRIWRVEFLFADDMEGANGDQTPEILTG
ncbi:MAG: hypothetical protein RBQ99_02945 [Trichlorobacter sp.]|jgi:hypothetical protein|nr:hypothetical protein [Trichlorobacter sp.]